MRPQLVQIAQTLIEDGMSTDMSALERLRTPESRATRTLPVLTRPWPSGCLTEGLPTTGTCYSAPRPTLNECLALWVLKNSASFLRFWG